MNQTKIAVLVSGGGTNLQALIDQWNQGNLPDGELALVVSSKPGVFALERAKKAGIPSAVVPKKGNAEFEQQLLSLLKEHEIQLIVLAGFLCILSKEFVSQYQNRIINVHPSLIPSFCGEGFYGLGVHQAALDYGVKVTGATVHFVNEIPDGGQIILQKAVEILPEDTAESLQQRVMKEAEWELLPRACQQVAKQIREESK